MTTRTAVKFSCTIRLTRSMLFCIREYRGLTWLMIRNRITPRSGAATRKISASLALMENDRQRAVTIITGARTMGRRPVVTAF